MNKIYKQKIFVGLITLLVFNLSLLILNESKAQEIENPGSECILCPQFVPTCSQSEKLVSQTCSQCAHCEQLEAVERSTPSESLPSSDCQKCILHSQCQNGNICINNCCSPRPENTIKRTSRKASTCKSCTRSGECSKNEYCQNGCCVIRPKKQSFKSSKKSSCVFCPQFVPECKKDEVLVKQTCTKCAHCEPVKAMAITATTATTSAKTITSKDKDIKCKKPCGSKCCNKDEKCIVIDQCKDKKSSCKLPVLKYCSKKSPEKLSGRLKPL